MSCALKIISTLQKQKTLTNSNWNVSYRIGKLISTLVKSYNCLNILEVGTSNGYSGLWILSHLDEKSKLTTIEIDLNRFNEAKENFSRAGVSNQVNSLNGDVFEVLNTYNFDLKFDCVFLDAQQKRYIDLVNLLFEKDLISEGCIFLADNVSSHGYMDSFIDFMESIDFRVEVFDIDSGLMIARK